jgi:integrase
MDEPDSTQNAGHSTATAVDKKEEQETRKHYPQLGTTYLRGKTWWIEYWRHNHHYRESSKSQRELDALKLLRKRHREMDRDEFVSPKATKVTLGELFDAVVADYTRKGNRSSETLDYRLTPLRKALGPILAVELSEGRIERYRADRLAEGCKDTTVNRELAVIRRAYKIATRGKDKRVSPNSVPSIEIARENNARQGFVDYEDFLALVRHLPSPIDDIAWFAYRSGWRKGEVLSLTWSDVDQARGVITLRSENSKNKEPRELPLATPGLRDVIARRWQARLVVTKDGPKVCDYLFHRGGKPVLNFRKVWETACKAIGRPDLLFHDLRRSAVRNMVNAGVREKVAMKVTGHKTRSVFDRYHIVDDRDVREALERTEAAFVVDLHKMATFPPQSSREASHTMTVNGA